MGMVREGKLKRNVPYRTSCRDHIVKSFGESKADKRLMQGASHLLPIEPSEMERGHREVFGDLTELRRHAQALNERIVGSPGNSDLARGQLACSSIT